MTSHILSRLHSAWKQTVLLRDGYTCQFPGCTANTNLDAHHLRPRRYRDTAYFPANGVTLCRKHHQQIHRTILDRNEFTAYITEQRKKGYANA